MRQQRSRQVPAVAVPPFIGALLRWTRGLDCRHVGGRRHVGTSERYPTGLDSAPARTARCGATRRPSGRREPWRSETRTGRGCGSRRLQARSVDGVKRLASTSTWEAEPPQSPTRSMPQAMRRPGVTLAWRYTSGNPGLHRGHGRDRDPRAMHPDRARAVRRPCSAGKLPGRSYSRHRQRAGGWRSPAPACIEADCPELCRIRHHEIDRPTACST